MNNGWSPVADEHLLKKKRLEIFLVRKDRNMFENRNGCLQMSRPEIQRPELRA